MRRLLASAALVALLLPALVPAGGSAPEAPAPGAARYILHYTAAETVPSDAALAAHGAQLVYRFRAIPAVGVAADAGVLAKLRADPALRHVEADRELTWMLDSATFATLAADVWGTAWWPDPTAVARRPALSVHGEPIDGRGVVVGVVDTGINALHPDLWYAPLHLGAAPPWDAKVLACVNPLLLGLDSPDCDQTVGHGTHVAGIVAGTGWAARNNLTPGQSWLRPFVGAAPGAKLVGAGTGAYIFVLDAAAGLDWMYDHQEQYGIRVVTNSWGNAPDCPDELPDPDGAIIQLTDRLVKVKGVVVLFAAGNYLGGPTWTNEYARNPTPGVISVANYYDFDLGSRKVTIASSSSDGCVEGAAGADQLWTWPDVAAPGTNIVSASAYTSAYGPLSISIIGQPQPNVGDLPWYVPLSGTSMATPHVAGIVALMLQANPSLTPAEVERILTATATPFKDNVVARSVQPTAMWGANAAAAAFTDRDACHVSPADAALAEAGDTAVDAEFPRFTELAALGDAGIYVCRDFKRGNGLVHAYAAVQQALALAP